MDELSVFRSSRRTSVSVYWKKYNWQVNKLIQLTIFVEKIKIHNKMASTAVCSQSINKSFVSPGCKSLFFSWFNIGFSFFMIFLSLIHSLIYFSSMTWVLPETTYRWGYRIFSPCRIHASSALLSTVYFQCKPREPGK